MRIGRVSHVYFSFFVNQVLMYGYVIFIKITKL